MEFCYLEFCLNLVFWSCHPVPVDPSGDCIRVLCWDELLFVAYFGMFWLLCVENFGFRFHLWFCIKFTDLLLMGSVEFCLFLGLSL